MRFAAGVDEAGRPIDVREPQGRGASRHHAGGRPGAGTARACFSARGAGWPADDECRDGSGLYGRREGSREGTMLSAPSLGGNLEDIMYFCES